MKSECLYCGKEIMYGDICEKCKIDDMLKDDDVAGKRSYIG